MEHMDKTFLSIAPSQDVHVSKDALIGGNKGKRLRVHAKATHAGRLTLNGSLYLPTRMRDGINTWTSPYKKPIEAHHNDFQDPIGRVVSSEFIKEIDSRVPSNVADAAFDMGDPSKSNLWWIDSIYDLLMDPQFTGFGYTNLTYDITDNDAIEKILDERFLTVSVGHVTNDRICSVCKNSIYSEDCDHCSGQVEDGRAVFMIHDHMINTEMSYVNGPADELAMHYATEMQTKDSRDSKDLNVFAKHIDKAKFTLYGYDSNNKIYLPDTIPGGNQMKYTMTNLLKNSEDNYKIVRGFLSEDKALSTDALKELDDSSFIGSNRTFPAIDSEHVEAIGKVLADTNDSAAKTELSKLLTQVKDSFADEANAKAQKDALMSKDSFSGFTKDEFQKAYNSVVEAAKDAQIELSIGETADENEFSEALEIVKSHNDRLQSMNDLTQDAIETLTTELREVYSGNIIGLQKQLGTEVKDEAKELENLNLKSLQSLKDLFGTLSSMAKSNDSSDANTNTNGEDDPTLHSQSDDPSTKDKNKKVKDHYNFLLINAGQQAATDYMNMSITNGNFKSTKDNN